MNYQTLFKAASEKTVRAAIIGAGEFGVSFVSQARLVPGLEVPAVCNRTVSKAVRAFVIAGAAENDVKVCESEAEVKKAYESGKLVAVSDAMLLMGLPLDVMVEGTGNPEVGAKYAEAAIDNGMHVVMVSKETDSVVGPILCRKAIRAGLIYTTVEGDQPSLLIELITWGRALGMNILCAGKSSEYDFMYDPIAQTVSRADVSVDVPDFDKLWLMGNTPAPEMYQARRSMLSGLTQRATPDLCEMSLVCNATGMRPSTEMLNSAVSRTVEVPEFMTTRDMGGILETGGVLDVVNCLRRDEDSSMAGGVFIVVECQDRVTWDMLIAKGHPANRDNSCAMIHRPVHLLGVEAPISVMAAALMNHATGAEEMKPLSDMAGRTTRDLKAGTRLQAGGHHHDIDGVAAIIVNGAPADGANPAPFYMMDGGVLKSDVPAGTIITCDMVELPGDSVMARLRAEQDRVFH